MSVVSPLLFGGFKWQSNGCFKSLQNNNLRPESDQSPEIFQRKLSNAASVATLFICFPITCAPPRSCLSLRCVRRSRRKKERAASLFPIRVNWRIQTLKNLSNHIWQKQLGQHWIDFPPPDAITDSIVFRPEEIDANWQLFWWSWSHCLNIWTVA